MEIPFDTASKTLLAYDLLNNPSLGREETKTIILYSSWLPFRAREVMLLHDYYENLGSLISTGPGQAFVLFPFSHLLAGI